jgi:hypothetical protein
VRLSREDFTLAARVAFEPLDRDDFEPLGRDDLALPAGDAFAPPGRDDFALPRFRFLAVDITGGCRRAL